MSKDQKLAEALKILTDLGMPRQQLNERTSLCLLALLNLSSEKAWSQAGDPLIGITPIMSWSKKYYGKAYAPNSRETFRRFSMHQFVQAGLVLYNPDKPDRPVNSPNAVYQIEPFLLAVLKLYGTKNYTTQLAQYQKKNKSLILKYAKEREMHLVPVRISKDQDIKLSAGEHSQLIKEIIEKFAPRFVPGGVLVYVGDTGDKWGYFNQKLLSQLGVTVDNHGKMPDVVIYYTEKNWLLLIESVTSHGPVDSKRHEELGKLFKGSKAGLVYVSAFPTKKMMNKYLEVISWETEVWVSETPSHLIHFNGDKFLGPHIV